MTLLPLLTMGTLVWLSGVLFSAGWHEVRGSRPHAAQGSVWAAGALGRHWGGALIWTAVALAALWAIAIVMGEIAGSEVWSLTRAHFWAH
jgi:hypothetical protein